MAEDTPLLEEVSIEAVKNTLTAQSELDKDVKILGAKIDASLSIIRNELNSLAQLRELLTKRVEVEK